MSNNVTRENNNNNIQYMKFRQRENDWIRYEIRTDRENLIINRERSLPVTSALTRSVINKVLSCAGAVSTDSWSTVGVTDGWSWSLFAHIHILPSTRTQSPSPPLPPTTPNNTLMNSSLSDQTRSSHPLICGFHPPHPCEFVNQSKPNTLWAQLKNKRPCFFNGEGWLLSFWW